MEWVVDTIITEHTGLYPVKGTDGAKRTTVLLPNWSTIDSSEGRGYV